MNSFYLLKGSELNKKQQLILLLIFSVVAFIFYDNTLNNGYSLDDEYAYTSNVLATNGLNNVEAIFSSNSFQYGSTNFGYRPLPLLSFAIENHFFGINAKASHFINLLLYILGSFLFLRVLLKLFENETAIFSIVTAFLFLVLPIHSEIVNNIKCRDELLMLLFGLLALYYWLKAENNWLYKLLAILFLLASFLSKKSGFIFLGILPVASYFQSNGNWKKGLSAFLLMISPVVLFKLFTKLFKSSKSLRAYSFAENPLYGDELAYNKLVIILESIWFYFKMLCLPTNFVSYYGYKTIEINNFQVASFLALILMLVVLVFSIKGLKNCKPFAFGGIVLLGGMLAIVNLLMPMVGIIAERFITVASLGFVIFIVFGIAELLKRFNKQRWYKYAFSLIMVYTIIYIPIIRARNVEWKSQISVMQADIEKEPESVVLNNSLANNYFFQFVNTKNPKQKNEAGIKSLKYAKNSIETFPTVSAYVNLASAEYLVNRKPKLAETYFLNALKIDSTYSEAIGKLALMYRETNQRQKSIKWYKKLIYLYPNDPNNYSNLIFQMAKEKEFSEAMKIVEMGMTKIPNDVELTLLKANLLNEQKMFSEALVWYKKAVELNPQNVRIKQQISFIKNQLKSQNLGEM